MPREFNEDELVAFYGALFALAAADGALEREELELLFGLLDLESLSAAGRAAVLGFAAEPPDFIWCIEQLEDSELRYPLLVQLIAIAISDYFVASEEQHYLDLSRAMFGVSDEQYDAMVDAAEKLYKMAASGTASMDDWQKVLRESADHFLAVGLPAAAAGALPLTALWFAGISGFSAVGITSGLAALAFGAGMIPGIGVIIGLGLGTFAGLSHLLGHAKRKREREGRRARQRINDLINYAKASQDAAELRYEMLDDEPDVYGDVAAEQRYLRKLMQTLERLIAKLRADLAAIA